MRHTTRIWTLAAATLLGWPGARLDAQTIDPAGHYAGVISSPAGELRLEIDLTQSAAGEIVGTLTVPAQKLQGFPLSNVIVKGTDVSFDIATSGGGYYRGDLTANGISGEFSTQMGPLPLDFQREGDAHTYPLPSGTPIARSLEGVWNGTLDVDGGMHVMLRLSSRADGTASGSLVSVDENNLTVPLVVVQNGSTVTLTSPMIGSSYVGTVNDTGSEMSGTYTTSRGLALKLLLKRGSAN